VEIVALKEQNMARNTEKTLETLADQAAERAIKRTQREEPEGDSFSHLAQLDADDGIDHESEGDKVANFDIFDHCENLVTKGQHQIKYEIKKNGEMLTTRYHPYSWERLQKDYKGGHYQVSAKSLTTKRFVKHETRSIAEPEEISRRHDRDEDDFDSRRNTVHQQAPQGPSFTEILTLLNNTANRERENAREVSREMANASNSSTLAMIEMMKTTSAQTQSMMMEIAKMTQAVSEKMAEQQQRIVERMDAKFEKLVEKFADKKDNGMSLTELLTLQNSAQEKGFAMFNKMATLAEAKTEERLALIEDARDERDSRADRGKKSLTDSLIESVLPTVATALAGVAAQNQAPQQVPAARGSVPRPQGTPRTFEAAQPRQRVAARAPQGYESQVRQASQGAGGTDGRPSGTVNGQSRVVKSDLGLPTVKFGADSSDIPLVPENAVSVTKNSIEQILTPIFGACLIERKEANLAAADIESALLQNGIDRPTFLQTVSKDDMMGIVKGYELPLEATPWFEEIYAHIQNAAGDVTREHAAG